MQKHTWLGAALVAAMFLPGRASAVEVCFSPGGAASGLSLIGDAVIDSGELQVTPDLNSQVGALWFEDKVSTAGEVHAYFVANISGNGGGADGVALVMQNQEASPIGTAGEGIGFSGITPSVAVEFDTYANTNDPDHNHVAIILDGDVTTHTAVFSPSWTLEGNLTHVWVDYASGTLDVYVAQDATKPGSATMSHSIDLSTALGTDFWVGLTGSTGGLASRHAFSHVVFQEGAVVDTDSDNVPDVCEDRDGDGIPDGQEDRDHATFGDVDGDSIDAGDDTDSDGDGTDDAVEGAGDTDGDTIPDYLDNDTDGDGDGVDDLVDPCPLDNPDDSDSDSVCDSVDVCEGDDATGDTDEDGVCDDADVCTGDDATGDTDEDGVCDDADVCTGDDATGDTDGDGICNDSDDCDGDNTADADEDGICDAADLCTGDDATGDTDEDGVCGDQDACEGDDASGDSDGDGECDDIDECPDVAGSCDVDACDSGLGDTACGGTAQTGCRADVTAGAGGALGFLSLGLLAAMRLRRRRNH